MYIEPRYASLLLSETAAILDQYSQFGIDGAHVKHRFALTCVAVKSTWCYNLGQTHEVTERKGKTCVSTTKSQAPAFTQNWKKTWWIEVSSHASAMARQVPP